MRLSCDIVHKHGAERDHNSQDVFDGPRHDTALLASLAVKRVGLSRLRRSKEDDSAILTLDEGLHDGFDALPVELVLSLHFAEDIIELEDVSIVAVRRTVLPKLIDNHLSEL